MPRSLSTSPSLNHLEWAGYVRFMREELEALSPEAAEHLRQAERTLLQQAGGLTPSALVLPRTQPGLGH